MPIIVIISCDRSVSTLLQRTKVADAGLVYLMGLTNLQSLILIRTKVTDAGVKKLQAALPKCGIVR